ncbi:uncharacterized protein LOC126278611 isoform X2 [Schistocerca gregaria]|uniref:uncharacterized protein LOC126278611 isoform X2 n=1 Tax=Schistocerca gregaria TaxID=7010 RepID=UPI00211E292C|nr:uncharacterized protein LOC126278611 isoform X2 [Schistocerca gregaria]
MYMEEILPQWKTSVLELHRNDCNVQEIKSLNILVDVKTREEFGQWLAQFENITKTTYTIRCTEPASGKYIVFKQRLVCHHNTRSIKVHGSVQRATKNTNCPSKMTLTIHAVHDRYRGKYVEKAMLCKEMPCEVNLVLCHNLSVESAAALRFRQPSSDVKEKLISLFERGRSPATALESIKVEIQLNCSDYPLVLADRSRCPDYNFCHYLFNKVFKKKYGPTDFNKEGKHLLQQRLEEYNSEVGAVCAKMIQKDDDYIVCICSPLMQKVHTRVKAASKLVFMDHKLRSCRNGTRVAERDSGGKYFWGNINGPSVFLTDDSQSEQNAIRRCFPNTKTLLCIFHVLQTVWRWLLKAKNAIPQQKQCAFFQNLKKKIMFAQTKNEAVVNYNVTRANIGVDHQNLLKYLEGYWDRKELWTLSHRRGMLIEGHNTNNISEAFMRILKDRIFERVRAFNVVQMVDFFLTKVNLYFQRRLLDAANGASPKYFCRPIKAPSQEILAKIRKVNEDVLLIPSEERENHYYIVNMAVLVCTCCQGNTGKICKHIDWGSTVLPSGNYREVTDSDSIRRQYYFIATNEEPPEGWLEPLYCSQNAGASNSSERLEQMDTGLLCESQEEMPDTLHMETVPDKRNIDLIDEIKARLIDFSNKSPEEMRKGLEVMCEKLRKLKTLSACVSYLANFGEGKSRKNCGNYIPVQPTAISRRKNKLAGRRCHPGGRQRPHSKQSKEFVKTVEISEMATFPSPATQSCQSASDF